LAVTAWFLSARFPELDRDLLIRISLAHDLIEVHAGDTFAFADKATVRTKALREAAAMELLETEWPDFPELLAALRMYHEKNTPEAKFVYALDKIMPMMVVFLGQGYSWHKFGITHAHQHEVKASKVAVSPEIKEYYDQLYQLLSEYSHYFPEPSQQR
jgi:putative hydrolases of HD superfamily